MRDGLISYDKRKGWRGVLKNKSFNKDWNNDLDKFKVQQNEKIIIGNISEKISEIIISSIINLDDN